MKLKSLAICALLAATLGINMQKGQAKIYHPQQNAIQSELWGDLIVRSTKGHPEMILRTADREIQLSNVHTHWDTCLNGTFLIAQDEETQEYQLLDVLSCEQEIKPQDQQSTQTQRLSCPEIYAPVCGVTSGRAYSDTRTYSNLCEMNNEKGNFLHHGSCEQDQ